MKWTKKQEEAINAKGEILVAAAAGSGKTSVLVERSIKRILEEKIDINKILSITFTNAAANEVKERILSALYNELDKNEDDNIKKQIRLLPMANISTLHSFCFNLIKENFFSLGIASDVSIAKTEEKDILINEALDEVLNLEYENMNEDFIKLLNFYPGYRNDNQLREDILKVYDFLVSIPFYKDWIKDAISNMLEENTNYAKTLYGSILMNEAKEIINSSISNLENERIAIASDFNLEKFSDALIDDIDQLDKLAKISDWDLLYEHLKEFKLKKWPNSRGIVSENKDRARGKRDKIKDDIKRVKSKYIREKSESIIEDNKETLKNIETIFDLTEKLDEKYSEYKNKKNILDFADLERLALKLLVEKKDYKFAKTDIAIQISNKYFEIQVDEYQDINMIQDLIIWAVSNNNVFRVGDLKQSIYKFRKANPDIFIAKYNKFLEKEEKIEESKFDQTNAGRKSIEEQENIDNASYEIENGTKILLYQNFRSRKNVIDFCNDLFSKIMSKELGEIDYNKNEYLNYSADYDDKNITTDIVVVSKDKFYFINDGIEELDDSTVANYDDYNDINDEDPENEFDDINNEDPENEFDDFIQKNEIKELIENNKNVQLEAYYIAEKIKELIDSKFQIKDKDVYRSIEYRDIVILLRTAKEKAEIIEKILYKKGIPVYTDSSNNFLESIEIATVISLLKIIDNPLSDIDLTSVLRSYFGGFTLNEISKIRKSNNKARMYDSLLEYYNKTDDQKVGAFIKKINELREIEKYFGITKLLNKILLETGYLNYISLENNGEIKKANLTLFLNRAEEYENAGNVGLYRFIEYLENLEIGTLDLVSANIIGEKENVVRIMTIHSSKGLEFPIVILADASKKINLEDVRKRLLLNLNYGIAIDYFDSKRKIKYPTLIKEAIKLKTKEEIIAEEMRMLYVALTRAKEKLIIIGSKNDGNKYLDEINSLSEIYTVASKDEVKYYISPYILKSRVSYLDWILLSEKLGLSNTSIRLISAEKLDFEEEKDEKEILKFSENDFNNETIYNVNMKLKLLEYEYNNQKQSYTKLSASRININDENKVEEDIKNASMKKPSFMKLKDFSKAEIGTLTHYFLQKLNFTKIYSKKELEAELNKMVEKSLLSKEESELIDLNSILLFVESDEYLKIINSYQVKEKQFLTKFNLSELNEILDNEKIDDDEEVLVQGMIDLYYITNDNILKILDYKTDNADIDTIKSRYKIQMLIYKNALEKALKRKVDKILIYSTINNSYIEI